jgi:hypothetical protein
MNNMEEHDFNWTTTFKTSKSTMTHHFNHRVKMVVDFRNGFIKKVIDEKEVEQIGFDKCYSLTDYNDYQHKVAQEAGQYRKEE